MPNISKLETSIGRNISLILKGLWPLTHKATSWMLGQLISTFSPSLLVTLVLFQKHCGLQQPAIRLQAGCQGNSSDSIKTVEQTMVPHLQPFLMISFTFSRYEQTCGGSILHFTLFYLLVCSCLVLCLSISTFQVRQNPEMKNRKSIFLCAQHPRLHSQPFEGV